MRPRRWFSHLQKDLGSQHSRLWPADCPVIASRAGALPEVLGDAGLLFDPHSADELAARLELLLNDASLRAQLSRRGLERARLFTWERSAQAALDAFEQVAA